MIEAATSSLLDLFRIKQIWILYFLLKFIGGEKELSDSRHETDARTKQREEKDENDEWKD